MFKQHSWPKAFAIIGLAVFAALVASLNPGVGHAQSPLAGPTPTPRPVRAPKIAVAPNLGTAGSYAVLAGSAVTNVPAAGTVLTGNLGVWLNNAISGFPPGIVVPPGTINAGNAAAQSAESDLTTAYNAIGSGVQPCPPANNLTGIDLGTASPLVAGVYCFDTSAQLTGALTLNGNNTDVFIFQIGSTLTTATGSSVVLGGTVNACNVFWQVDSSATIGTSTAFKGNILALASITMNHGANIVSGRALARNGAVTLDDNVISAGGCPGGLTPGGVGVTAVFNPPVVTLGGTTAKIISLSNAGGSSVTITSFTDNLPAGMVVATPSGASNTCGGTLTAIAGSSTISMTGGSIPAASGGVPGVCTITVNVTATTVGSLTNPIAAGSLVTSGGSNTGSGGTVLSVNGGANQPRDVPESDTLLLFSGGVGGLATWLGWQLRKTRKRS